MRTVFSVVIVLALVCLLAQWSEAGVPNLINYQGKLTDSLGTSSDTTVSLIFSVYSIPNDGIPLWTETQPVVIVRNGVFDVLLGSVSSLPDSILRLPELWLGVTIGGDNETSPRQRISSVPFSLRAGNARDTYDGIKDLMPLSKVKFYVYPRYPNSKVTLYLHGEGFAGSLLAHTHTGTNSHSHSFSGSSGYESADHTHSYSGTSSLESSNHTHSGTTDNSNVNISHSHSGDTDNGGTHAHDLRIHGTAQTSLFIVHRSETNNLTADGGGSPGIAVATQSVDPNQSAHSHHFGTSYSGSVGNSHTFSTGGVSANHSHTYSGTSGGRSVGHTHNFSGVTLSTGSGIANAGISAGTLPSGVKVYVDGVLSAGPWSGQFSSGAINLSSFVPDAQEHMIEIREEGGTGGQIIYALFVE